MSIHFSLISTTDKFVTRSSYIVMNIKLIYVLLDGIGDLPHASLDNLTPLDAAFTPNMDALAKNGCMGQVISVGKGIAPQSDIAVFNMLGYNFKDESYVGRGVIESIGSNIDFHDGDLALRGNFATVDSGLQLVDRRAGRIISSEESRAVCKTLSEKIRFTDKDASVVIEPTVGHRVTIRFRHNRIKLSDKITNTDPAYDKVNGVGVAKPTVNDMNIEKSKAQENTEGSEIAARLVNEFTEQSIIWLKEHPVNTARIDAGKKPMNAILLRDAGNRYPTVTPIAEKYGTRVACLVDMPVEVGISKVLGMNAFDAGDINDYEKKGTIAAKLIEKFNILYVHIKGPDEFGHDGDATGKKKNIEEIDKRFFGNLTTNLRVIDPTIVISGDHSTPCNLKGHSDDPVPLLVSGNKAYKDNSARFTEYYASKGNLGLLMGVDVLTTAMNSIFK
jgi:2,3-bisphosphoglycerate-independent phosphoglycerate mutase